MELKRESYKGVVMEFDIDTDKGTFTGSALGIMTSYRHQHYGWNTLSEAREDLKIKIDEFLESTPKTYKELSEHITGSLVWTGYEECHADEGIIKVLVSNFIKYNNRDE